ncbi:MAG: hypothetical protein A2075_21775 [Geobacteraceae bacterium GWC2_58_44]|nr:MAG: hypothetical protein A2075_21775 [Geobacteraceae bacterium GWC2_58_44]HBG06960.1 PEP-CTERM sorting domain-containing protein [Geobacter sp.]
MNFLKAACIVSILAISAGLTAKQAEATVINSLPGGSLIGMPTENYFGPGERSVAAGITWSSNKTNSVFGYNGVYGFAENGIWNSLTMAGLNSSTGVMTFSFATPVNGVGGYLNYAPNSGPSPTVSVYDSGMNLLESSSLTFNTGGGMYSGQFFGFLQDNISFFTLSDAYIGLTNLTVSRQPDLQETEPVFLRGAQPAPVPEPSTFLLFGAGILGIGLLRRKMRK